MTAKEKVAFGLLMGVEQFWQCLRAFLVDFSFISPFSVIVTVQERIEHSFLAQVAAFAIGKHEIGEKNSVLTVGGCGPVFKCFFVCSRAFLVICHVW